MKKENILSIVLFLILVLVLLNRSCEKSQTIVTVNDLAVDSLENENADLMDQKNALEGEIVKLDSTIYDYQSKVNKGKVRIKTIKETITITDTIVLTYTEALERQLVDFDSLVTQQQKKIVKQAKIIVKQDTIIINKDKIIELAYQENEILIAESKKKDRKIKLLKIERVAYPAIVALLAIFSLN